MSFVADGGIALKQAYRGISLLEVMVALGVLSTFLFVLLHTQGQFLRLSSKARALTIATSLASEKLHDCKHLLETKKLDEAASFHERGDFAKQAHPEFTWECHSYPFDVPTPNTTQAAVGIGQQGSKKAEQDFGLPGMNVSAAAVGPTVQIITKGFRKAVRELVVIVKWPGDELQVTTHVINTAPILMLIQTLPDASALFPAAGKQQSPTGEAEKSKQKP
ncbi:MAG: hypothetical protein AAF320_04745 [Myxococcota bacterium]